MIKYEKIIRIVYTYYFKTQFVFTLFNRVRFVANAYFSHNSNDFKTRGTALKNT